MVLWRTDEPITKHRYSRPPGLQLEMPPWVVWISWCLQFEFRGGRRALPQSLLKPVPEKGVRANEAVSS